MAEKKNMNENPFLRRYSPLDRYTQGSGFASQREYVLNPVDYGESVTDKDSYRLSLAASRAGAGITQAVNPAQYMYQDGKYNSALDLSFIMRKDLTRQEADAYINAMKLQRQTADETLKAEIDEALKKLESAKLADFKKSESEKETVAQPAAKE